MLVHQNQCNPPAEHSAEGVPSFRELLEKVLSQSEAWLASMEPHNVEREHVEHLANLAERLLAGETIALVAMEQVRKYLCGSCKRLNAAKNHNGCNGRALGYCPILSERVVERR